MATIRAIAAWFDKRRRLIALSLAGWIVLVVIGAGRDPGATDRFSIPDLGGLVLAALAALAVLGAILLVFMRPNGPAPHRRREPTRSLRSLLLTTLVILLLLFALAPGDSSDEEASPPPEPAVPTLRGEVPATTDNRGGADGPDIAALMLICVVAGAVLLASARRSAAVGVGGADEPEVPLEAEFGPAVDEAAQLLRIGSDPRTAVLAAYASLERALAGRGEHRHPADTPAEHMAGVMAAAPALTGPAVRLGRLYEIARFSDQPISNDDRDRAAEALTEALGTIATPASGPA